jgi:serine protease Do
MSLQDAIQTARRSIVRLSAGASEGSGVAIAPNRVITNAHVVAGYTSVIVADEPGTVWHARVNWRDGAADLATIGIGDPPVEPIAIGDPAQLREGDDVIAVGHPLGLSFTVTRGIVSARSRLYAGQSYIQTDAAINPGNSGGALLNSDGALVGLNTFLLRDAQSLNFAIPIDRALNLMNSSLAPNRTATDSCCPRCESFVSPDEVYCPACGSRQDREFGAVEPAGTDAVAASNLRSQQCVSCGTVQATPSRYCQRCGARTGGK